MAGGVQSTILGDAESVDYDAATQQTMSNLQSREPPKNAESFRPSGDKTADAKATLTQAALQAKMPDIRLVRPERKASPRVKPIAII
jgi:conjugal transfer mating pair stabilization protein TraG